jgi:hypothetical protein
MMTAGVHDVVVSFYPENERVHFFPSMRTVGREFKEFVEKNDKYQLLAKVEGLRSQIKQTATVFR